jgi:hypothetical protein
LRVEGQLLIPSTPSDVGEVAKEDGLMALLDVGIRQRSGADALKEVFDVRRIALATVSLLDDPVFLVEYLPSAAVPAQVHVRVRSKDLDLRGAKLPIGKEISIPDVWSNLLHVRRPEPALEEQRETIVLVGGELGVRGVAAIAKDNDATRVGDGFGRRRIAQDVSRQVELVDRIAGDWAATVFGLVEPVSPG